MVPGAEAATAWNVHRMEMHREGIHGQTKPQLQGAAMVQDPAPVFKIHSRQTLVQALHLRYRQNLSNNPSSPQQTRTAADQVTAGPTRQAADRVTAGPPQRAAVGLADPVE